MRRSIILGISFLFGACSTKAVDRDQPVAPMAAVSDDAVVATVDGRPIYAAAVAAQARARGVDVKTALADLVDAEALAGEAHRRGLDRALDVRLATKGALARRYLQTTFDGRPASSASASTSIQRFGGSHFLTTCLLAPCFFTAAAVASVANDAASTMIRMVRIMRALSRSRPLSAHRP